MKRIINFIFLFLILHSNFTFAAMNVPPTQQEKQYLTKELLINPSFENFMSGWSATTTQPLSQTTKIRAGSTKGFSWNPTGADIFRSSANAQLVIPAGVSGYLYGACYVALIDDTHTYTLEIYDTTNGSMLASQALPADASGNLKLVETEALVVPNVAARSIALRIQATADEALINGDDCTLHFRDTSKVVGVNNSWTSYSNGSQGFGSPTYTKLQYRRDGSDLLLDAKITLGTRTAAEARLNLPLGINSASHIATLEQCGTVVSNAQTSIYYTILCEPSVNYVTFGFNNDTGSGLNKKLGNAIFADGTVLSITARIPIQGWDAGLNSSSDQVDWRVDATITGANPSLGTSAVSSYTGIENGSLTLTNNSTTKGSLTNVMIPCSSTNDSTGTTCSSGNESVGIAFTPPKVAWVEVCASFVWRADIAASAAIGATFQIVKTPNNAQTIIAEGGAKVTASHSTGTVTNIGHPFPNVCGTFFLDSISKHTFRLMYEQGVSGTITSSDIAADAAGSAGQRDIYWTVKPLVNFGTILQFQNRSTTKYLASNVNTNTTGIASLQFNNLIIGKNYKVTIFSSMQLTATSSTAALDIMHNGSRVARTYLAAPGLASISNLYGSSGPMFTATATTVTANFGVTGSATLYGTGTTEQTYVTLEELNNTVPGNF